MNKNYQAFASLIADGFFELDRQLRYTYQEGKEAYLTNTSKEVLGKNRIEVMEASLDNSQPLAQHNRSLRAHQSVDVVIPALSADGEAVYTQVVAQPQFDSDGEFTGYIGCTRDVTERVREAQHIAHQASHDDLTGVINRREFESRLAKIVETQVERSKPHALCFIDLDKFKYVNDTAGHPAGDQLLRNLTTVMRSFVRGSETLARLGGDEFGLLLEADSSQASIVAERMIDAISQYVFEWDGQEFKVGASIGITEITAKSKSVDDVLSEADNACYSAKDSGRNQSFIYGAESISYHQRRRDIAQNDLIKEALNEQRFTLFLQPILSNNDIADVKMREVLVRLKCKNGRLMSPAEFMPIATQYDLMQNLDTWVVENSMLALQQLKKQGDKCKLSINLSPNSLNDSDMLQNLVSIVSDSPVASESICFEFTEAAVMRNLEAVHSFMAHLRAEGVQFALDDFGGGLSSLSYIRDLPIDYIKLDQSFIKNIVHDEPNKIIVSSISSMAKQLGIKTVAKSVENVETRHCLIDIGIDYSQGFGVAKPKELSGFLQAETLQPLRRVVA